MSVGARLAAARVARGMSLADVAAASKLRVTVLAHIEAERWDRLDDDVFVRAHLKSFAQAVGEDPLDVVREYLGGLSQGSAAAGEAATPAKDSSRTEDDIFTTIAKRPVPQRRNPTVPLVIASLAALLALIAYVKIGPGAGDSDSELLPSPSASKSASPSGSAEQSATASASATLDPAVVTLQMKLTGTSWVLVTSASGEVLQPGATLRAGTDLTFVAGESITIKMGNAGAVQLVVNGVDLGVQGDSGAVLTRTFGLGDPSLNN